MRFLRLLTPALMLVAFAAGPSAAQAQKASPRIIAGSDVSISTYPFQIALYLNGSFSCGGSIRDATHVITAAHCVTSGPNAPHVPFAAPQFQVRYGSDTRDASQARVGVDAISVPSEYTQLTPDESYDVAVLTLSAPIDLSGPNAKAIPIANAAQTKTAGSALVTGWGDTAFQGNVSTTLKGTRVPLRPDAACTSEYQSYYVPARSVCAGGGNQSQNPDTCQGDSGGPLVVDVASPSWASRATATDAASKACPPSTRGRRAPESAVSSAPRPTRRPPYALGATPTRGPPARGPRPLRRPRRQPRHRQRPLPHRSLPQ